MTNTTQVGFFVPPPTTPAPYAGAARGLTRPPRRRSDILSWIGAMLFAVDDAEAIWWNWEIHQRHAGLGRRYRDPRFYLRTIIPGPVTVLDNAGSK
jgi:hypothetical protein